MAEKALFALWKARHATGVDRWRCWLVGVFVRVLRGS